MSVLITNVKLGVFLQLVIIYYYVVFLPMFVLIVYCIENNGFVKSMSLHVFCVFCVLYELIREMKKRSMVFRIHLKSCKSCANGSHG